MAELVGNAFLSASFQVVFERLASSGIADCFGGRKLNDGLLKKLYVTFNSINQVLEDAEVMQYKSSHVKKWLDDLKHAVYDAVQLLDEMATEASRQMPEAESQPATEKMLLFKGGFSLNAERLSERTYIEDENHWHSNLENRSAGKGKICEYNGLEWSWPLFTGSSEEEDSDRRSDSCSDEFSGPSSL